MNARGRALRIAVLPAVAASTQAAAPRRPPRHFGRLTVARMGALANYTYVERLSAGMPGHLIATTGACTTVTCQGLPSCLPGARSGS